MLPLSNQQRLHLVNTGQLHAGWKDARRASRHYLYGMHWKRIRGKDYLYRPVDAAGNAKSLGPRGPNTERVYAEFEQGRQRNLARVSELKSKLDEQSRLNKALRLNRVPLTAARVLRRLWERDALKDFRVIGTFALYAYEPFAGVAFMLELLASGDVDLLYDPRKKLTLVSAKLADKGLIGVLKEADSTFSKVEGQRFRAANDAGFLVDLIIPPTDMRGHPPPTFADADLEPSEAPGLQWLQNAPSLEIMAVAEDGWPVDFHVPDPRAFAVHKLWLSRQPGRDPLKRQRDADQATVLAAVVREHLPHLAFEADHLKFFPSDVARETLEGLRSME